MRRGLMLALTLLGGVAAQAVAQDGPPPGGQEGQGGPGRGRGGPVMRAIDADGNGEISAEEIAGAVEKLKALDANGDGKLSGDEVRPPRGPDGDRGPRGDGGPGDGEGRRGPPNPEEFINRLMEADTDGDGKLSRDELKAGAEKMREGRRGGRGGRPDGEGGPRPEGAGGSEGPDDGPKPESERAPK